MEPAKPENSALASTPSSLPTKPEPDHRAQRWRLLRDLTVFQAKLLLDGVKDLVLAPVALLAVLVGLATHRDDPGQLFRTLLRWGHGFDRWVNLFGISEPVALPPANARSSSPGASPLFDADAPPSTHPSTPPFTPPATPPATVDAYVQRLEQALALQVQRGGLTAKAKDAIDKALDSLHERRPPP
ncbi:MAG: hypothetical protein AAGF11_53605 [Myxococcota bacterium]